MWSAEYTLVTDASKEAIWKIWADVENWRQWDEGVEWCRLEGEFKTGASHILKPKGGPKVKSTIMDCEPLKRFTAVTHFPFAKMEFVHELREDKDGLHITHRVVISGFLSFLFAQVIGKNTARDFPKTLGNLAQVAKASQ